MSTATLSQNGFHRQVSMASDSSKPQNSTAWLSQKVGVFLQGVNWEDRPPAVQVLVQEANTSGLPLSLRLKVGQFFEAIPWQGGPSAQLPLVIPATPNLPVARSAEDFTLDDFSDGF
ncbi:hypothetical protein [Leptolyngbya sp. FACHB-261]|uniref:hypothetical protein n=1 Tax=Leptolyngbya sp. FACHB-261 TaxID=2692806 RepID=UPI0016843969|nr:hypothetical protein [Leptolyngbya sp. FACHB-261]MBD2101163.1 hypothetical protein [Leptolyngbya sp. FACHB-261]